MPFDPTLNGSDSSPEPRPKHSPPPTRPDPTTEKTLSRQGEILFLPAAALRHVCLTISSKRANETRAVRIARARARASAC
jgi:hypothetical protein